MEKEKVALVCLRHWPRWAAVCLDIVRVPAEVAIEPIFNMRGRLEAVELAGVHDPFCFTPHTLQSLVHLLPTEDGHIPVDVAAHKARRRGDVCDPVVRRDFFPHCPILPGVPELHIVVENVLVMPVEC